MAARGGLKWRRVKYTEHTTRRPSRTRDYTERVTKTYFLPKTYTCFGSALGDDKLRKGNTCAGSFSDASCLVLGVLADVYLSHEFELRRRFNGSCCDSLSEVIKANQISYLHLSNKAAVKTKLYVLGDY